MSKRGCTKIKTIEFAVVFMPACFITAQIYHTSVLNTEYGVPLLLQR